MYYYLLVDPAAKKKKESDYTVMCVIGTDALRNYWLIDMVRDKLNLGERWESLKRLVLSWGLNDIGYEQYGAMSDVEFMNRMMQETGCYFRITELGGQVSKDDRIKKLVPDFQRGRWILPDSLVYRNVKGEFKDLMVDFQEEYESWVPGRNVGHDDMLDCLARIYESKMNVIFPTEIKPLENLVIDRDPLNIKSPKYQGTWMSE